MAPPFDSADRARVKGLTIDIREIFTRKGSESMQHAINFVSMTF